MPLCPLLYLPNSSTYCIHPSISLCRLLSPLALPQLEEFDHTCLEDILRFDYGASLAGYDFKANGFPPPASSGSTPPRQQEHSPEQHAAAAHPAPFFAASGSGGSGQPAGAATGGAGDAAAAAATAAAAAPASCLGAPACSRLDGASLAKLAHRFRRISKLMAFGLQALGSAAQRQKWEVRLLLRCLLRGLLCGLLSGLWQGRPLLQP